MWHNDLRLRARHGVQPTELLPDGAEPGPEGAVTKLVLSELGALSHEEYRRGLLDAGFTDVELTPTRAATSFNVTPW